MLTLVHQIKIYTLPSRCKMWLIIAYFALFQSVNKTLAKKLIDDKTREYMNARRVAKVLLVNLSLVHW